MEVEYYYENVCTSCNVEEDFYELYGQCIPLKERESLNVRIATYNVFMETGRARYDSEAQRLGIQKGMPFPVLIVGNQWVSGQEQIEAWLYRMVVQGEEVIHEDIPEYLEEDGTWTGFNEQELIQRLKAGQTPAVLLFTTNGCEECNEAKEWLEENKAVLGAEVLECNINKENCTGILQGLLQERECCILYR